MQMKTDRKLHGITRSFSSCLIALLDFSGPKFVVCGVFFLIFSFLLYYVRWNFDQRYAPHVGLGLLYKIKASRKRNASSRTFYSEGHGPETHVVVARARRERWK